MWPVDTTSPIPHRPPLTTLGSSCRLQAPHSWSQPDVPLQMDLSHCPTSSLVLLKSFHWLRRPQAEHNPSARCPGTASPAPASVSTMGTSPVTVHNTEQHLAPDPPSSTPAAACTQHPDPLCRANASASLGSPLRYHFRWGQTSLLGAPMTTQVYLGTAQSRPVLGELFAPLVPPPTPSMSSEPDTQLLIPVLPFPCLCRLQNGDKNSAHCT